LKALKGEAAWLTVPARWALWRRLTRDHPALLSLPLAFTRPSIRRSLSRLKQLFSDQAIAERPRPLSYQKQAQKQVLTKPETGEEVHARPK
ncbi:MAG: hypothetical protein AAF289_11195, partial [Cyanobacteria bacterium P01_A01_bin.135]